MSDTTLDESAIAYHREPRPGKLAIRATKPLATQRDLALAYSPGVAAACRAIVANPDEAANLTIRANLVGVVTNGTAVLGLGNIGPLAAKPVMEGKAVLFKQFAGIDVFDIEVNETDPEKLADIVAALEPTFGAINLEDIRAPECFQVEEALKARMKIPVFHDDQHGTAIVAGAALRNALRVVGKDIGDIRMVSSGGGAAGIACLNLMIEMGLKRENIVLVDIDGVVHAGRVNEINPQKAAFAIETEARTLAEVMPGADVFLGLSAPGVLTADMVKAMAPRPVILALANPEPEIDPDVARAVRPDAIIATGRSDYPNQVNNVLCFPFIFRGALDVGATTINEAMKIACVEAVANLALAESSEIVSKAYGGVDSSFGVDYLIPRPFDPRLIIEIAPAVARAAMESGVATRPIADMAAYREQLGRFVYRSGYLMKPIFEAAKRDPKRVAYAEGEDERVLRAARAGLDEGLVKPILIGRPDVIASRIERLGLRLQIDKDFDVVNPEDDARFNDYWQLYHQLMERKGISPMEARTMVRTNTTTIAALMVKRGEADAMLCGAEGRYTRHLRQVMDVIGRKDGVTDVSALSILILDRGPLFLCDTHVTHDPTAEEIAEMTMMAAEEMARIGVIAKAALLSHSDFGSVDSPSARKMRDALTILRQRAPDLEVEGEMNSDTAIDPAIRERLFPNSRLTGAANLLIFPDINAANIAVNLLKSASNGLLVGPLLLGAAAPVHILTPSVTARGLLNATALAVVDAQQGIG